MEQEEQETTPFLTDEEGRLLLRIARTALEQWVREQVRVSVESFPLTPRLRERHGAFVSLRINGMLRGCVGYAAAVEPLALTVRENAINAACLDTRFSPVSAQELPNIRVEVSVLIPADSQDSPFRRVQRLDEIEIGRDGLYIERDGARGGLLLPQVAADEGWDRETFLAAVCRKAEYPADAWPAPNCSLYRFSTQVFKETA